MVYVGLQEGQITQYSVHDRRPTPFIAYMNANPIILAYMKTNPIISRHTPYQTHEPYILQFPFISEETQIPLIYPLWCKVILPLYLALNITRVKIIHD